jgi:hypothetical protein
MQRTITFLMDLHERIVPDIMEWELTEFDVTKMQGKRLVSVYWVKDSGQTLGSYIQNIH